VCACLLGYLLREAPTPRSGNLASEILLCHNEGSLVAPLQQLAGTYKNHFLRVCEALPTFFIHFVTSIIYKAKHRTQRQSSHVFAPFFDIAKEVIATELLPAPVSYRQAKDLVCDLLLSITNI